jgi:hypothetical protein
VATVAYTDSLVVYSHPILFFQNKSKRSSGSFFLKKVPGSFFVHLTGAELGGAKKVTFCGFSIAGGKAFCFNLWVALGSQDKHPLFQKGV